MLFGAAALLWAAAGTAALASGKEEAQFDCRPIPEAAAAVTALNTFWDRTVRLCESADPDESAFARPESQTVEANRRWLADIARDYGEPAAIGILAHEWVHIVDPRDGPRAELQADCMAGVFLRWAGYGNKAVEQFALLDLHSGDVGIDFRSHGTGAQRSAAVLRGYRDSQDVALARMMRRCRTRSQSSG